MSEKDTERIRFSQVAASALAAVTAALLGSTMGVAGTVIGAGLASVVSTVGGVLYLRSIQRTRNSMLLVRSRVVARAGTTTVTVTERPAAGETAEATERETGEGGPAAEADGIGRAGELGRAGEMDEAGQVGETGETHQAGRSGEAGQVGETEAARGAPAGRRRTWAVVVAGSLAAFVLGMAVITGVEWLRGEPISGGEGTTLSKIVAPRHDDGEDPERERTPATEESTPTGTTGVPPETVTITPPPTEESPSDQPSTEPSTPETTPPATTTGNAPSGSASVPPTG